MSEPASNGEEQTLPTRRMHKGALAPVQESAERTWFHAYISDTPNPALVSDVDGIIVFANAQACALFRYLPDALTGTSIQQLVPERHRKQNARTRDSSIIRPVTGKLGVPSMYTGLRFDGTEFPMEFWVSEVKYPNGLVEIVYHFIDATERKRAETWFQLAVEASPTGMIIVNRAGKIVLANSQACRLFGYEKSELLELEIEELVPERYRASHPMLRKSYQDNPVVRPMGAGRDLFGRMRDGSEFPIEIGLNPLMTPDGIMVLCSIVDITERKAAEFELARKAEELAKTNAELDDFAYIASHDLQEPLLKVQSFGDLLALEYKANLGEEGADYIQRMQNASQRMKTLIFDLLNYSRVTRSKDRFRPVELGSVLKEVVNDLEIKVNELGAEFIVAELPTVVADPLQMRQLFQNILGNALKYHHPGRIPRIEITCEPTRLKSMESIDLDAGVDAVKIGIRDNGIGFEAKFSEEIFKPFRRLHSQRTYQGTGIGLAVCKKIIERHVGTIKAISQVNEGTTIEIVLPSLREDMDTKKWRRKPTN